MVCRGEDQSGELLLEKRRESEDLKITYVLGLCFYNPYCGREAYILLDWTETKADTCRTKKY